MHQHGFARPETGGVAEQEQRGREHERGRRRDRPRDLVGHRHRVLRPRSGHFRQAAARGERGHTLSDGQTRDTVADLPDRSGDLHTWRVWPGAAVAGVTAAGHHIDEVDPGVRHVDGHLTRPRPGLLDLEDLRAVHSL